MHAGGASRIRGSLLLRRRQIGAHAFEDLGAHADGFAERRVWMNCPTDIDGVAPHFDGQADFTDHIARMGSDDAAAEHAVVEIPSSSSGLSAPTRRSISSVLIGSPGE
jgi:hypothetical protein